ncbi:MAG: hypothetical protein H6835_14795 [Planctomycetes bacterium]|nr:hypothetical protein [Planctomycetota bacterium]
MAHRLLRSACLALLTLPFAGCFVGPHQLRRSVDDWDQKLYVNNPWLDAGLWLIPLIPVSTLGATVIDFLITDPYTFWFDDAWDLKGTGFRHARIEWTDGKADSMLRDFSDWTRSDSDHRPKVGDDR